MTQTTVKRQLTLLVQGILRKYHADISLEGEIALIENVYKFINSAPKTGQDAATVRNRILAAITAGQAEHEKSLDMEGRIFAALGLYVNQRWYQDGVIDFLKKRDNLGQTIETFAARCKADPYNMPKFFKIAEKPSLLMDTWGLAFPAGEKVVSMAVPDQDGGYR